MLYQFLMFFVIICLVGSLHSYEIQVTNFTSSWSDGTAFCAILHRHRPDILDYTSQVDEATPLENLQLAFDTAQNELGVEKLLDPEGLQCTVDLVVEAQFLYLCTLQFSSFLT